MDEKILVSSESYQLKSIFRIIIIVTILVTIGLIMYFAIDVINSYAQWYDKSTSYDTEVYNTYLSHQKAGFCDQWMVQGWQCSECSEIERVFRFINNNPTKAEYIRTSAKYWGPHIKDVAIDCLIPCFAIIFLIVLIQIWLRSYKLTVTNKRIYGTIVLGRRVDLPVDSVSAVSTVGLLKGVSIASSSGRISFLFIKNADEIYEEINNLLIERQSNVMKPVETKVDIPLSNADELKKFKDLLDSGVITQEEFDAKKKQLLGL